MAQGCTLACHIKSRASFFCSILHTGSIEGHEPEQALSGVRLSKHAIVHYPRCPTAICISTADPKAPSYPNREQKQPLPILPPPYPTLPTLLPYPAPRGPCATLLLRKKNSDRNN